MMNIAFVFVNFNSSILSIKCIESILEFNKHFKSTIVLVDNNSELSEFHILDEYLHHQKADNIKLISLEENLGYFKAINVGLSYIKKINASYDFVVVGNNDLLFTDKFFTSLGDNDFHLKQYAVIAPNIISKDSIHQNPHVINKISNSRKLVYKIYFSNFFLSILIHFISSKFSVFFKRPDTKEHEKSQIIRMGYGACYILTPLFFENFVSLDAPTFLMGEEAFLSHQLYSKGLNIYYEKSLIVRHWEHASVNKFKKYKMWKITKLAYRKYKQFL